MQLTRSLAEEEAEPPESTLVSVANMEAWEYVLAAGSFNYFKLILRFLWYTVRIEYK